MSAPLNLPLYKASFGAAVSRYFRNYAVFSGRASRSEYWWVALFNAIVFIVLIVGGVLLGGIGATPRASGGSEPGPLFAIAGVLMVLFVLGTIIPALSLGVRRLHDANLAGWFLLLGLIPSLGSILLLIFAVLPSSPAGSRFDRV
ncbi:DUF805 domain-containing protein [Microbacterium sp. 18062]|uniref:DUF805 domain-containing protein n=1 Tax=Microbacterium sp. 18062 TaxID=2681410 RepID=UPI001356B10A|nr:DUF805 domain-containing protein [Microbacterium sp. 18062]